MIALLFNRFSRAVIAAEIIGATLVTIGSARLILHGTGIAGAILIALCVLLYAFMRICASVRWYSGVPRYSGIELQFKKALVPTSYAMAITGIWFALAPSIAPLCILAFVLAVVAHVNVILIRFHLRDNDSTPVNYYSSGAFASDDAK